MNANTMNTDANGDTFAAPYRTFIEAIKVCFAKYTTFKGRASRSECWWFLLFIFLVDLAVFVACEYLLDNHVLSDSFFSQVWALLVILPAFAVGTRRLHDIGRSGWWQLLCILHWIWILIPHEYSDPYLTFFRISNIPLIALIVMWCLRAKPYPAT